MDELLDMNTQRGRGIESLPLPKEGGRHDGIMAALFPGKAG
jgi:hypothetical protein